MPMRSSLTLTLLFLVLLVASTGCAKKPKPALVPPSSTEPKVTESQRPPEETKTPGTGTETAIEFGDVFFDYDKFMLREDGRRTLNGNAKALLDNAAINSVMLEGHCDERGTIEYNLALGERRANTVRDYLVQYGVEPGRLSTISYGEERPFVEGHDESAWSQNRRVHFVKR